MTKRSFFFLTLFACTLFFRASLAEGLAEEGQSENLAKETLSISNAWIREAPPTAKVLAGYLEITNNSDQAITLISVESPCFNNVMLHRTELVDGIATMRHSAEVIIAANSSFNFAPGAHHLMLMGKKMPIVAGDDIELTLIFNQSDNNPDIKQKNIKIMAQVRKPAN